MPVKNVGGEACKTFAPLPVGCVGGALGECAVRGCSTRARSIADDPGGAGVRTVIGAGSTNPAALAASLRFGTSFGAYEER